MARELLPGADEATLAEVNLQLTARRSRARGVAFPRVRVSEAQVAAALEHSIPVASVASGLRPAWPDATAAADGGSSGGAAGALERVARFLQTRLNAPLPWPLRPRALRGPPPPALLAWHAQRQWLAVGDAPSGAVLIYDLDSAPDHGGGVEDGRGEVSEARLVLTHEMQAGLACLAWRPVHCTVLAAGVRGGALLWALGKPPVSAAAAAARGGAANGGAAAGAGGGGGPAWATFLRYSEGCSVSTLAWSPDGRLLAGAGPGCSRVMVWDAGLGTGAVLRLGLDPVALLRWSPCGAYLFAAGQGGRFHVAETSRWRTASWDSPPGTAVAAAAWAPLGRTLVLAFAGGGAGDGGAAEGGADAGGGGGGGVVALHLVGSPPSLVEQVLPVTLPEVTSLDRLPGGPLPRAGVVADLAWDPSGRRLAVLLRAPHPAAGLVALYSTTLAPLLHAELIGFARPLAATAPADADGDEIMGDDGGSGQGGAPPPAAALAFAQRLAKGGAVLSVAGRGRSGELVVSNIALAI